MLNHSDTKAFPSSAGTCHLRCFDVQPFVLIRAHRSAFRNLSIGGPGSLPATWTASPISRQPLPGVLVLFLVFCLPSPISQQPP